MGGSLVLANRDGGESQKAPDPAQPPVKAGSRQSAVGSEDSRKAPDPAPPARKPQSGSPIARPLPDPVALQGFLREVAKEAIKLARERPLPESSTLSDIAKMQAKLGDRAGAADTFKAALEEANGGSRLAPSASGLYRIGGAQLGVGMYQEARSTFLMAEHVPPEGTGKTNNILYLGAIVKYQARVGDRQHAREDLETLVALVGRAIKTSPNSNLADILLPDLAGFQAAAADFDGAFATVDRVRQRGSSLANFALGQIAQSVEFLNPLEMRRFIRRVTEELERIEDPSQRSQAFGILPEAMAWLGDYQTARKYALAIPQGPSWAGIDSQPNALLRVARVQKRAGDAAGAEETLRLAFESVQKRKTMRFAPEWLNQVAASQIAAGDLDGALRSTEAMERGQRASTLCSAAVAQCLMGDQKAARAILKKALDDLQFRPVHPPASKTAEPQVRHGAEVVRSSAVRPCGLAELYATEGEVEKALAAARSISDDWWKRRAVGLVVANRARAGDLLEALRIARGLKPVTDRRWALEHLADGLSYRIELEQGWREAKAPPHGR